MALHTATAWEMRTTGASDNGGGFYNRIPGTSIDYSIYDSPAVTFNGTLSHENDVLYDSGNRFTEAMVGNLIYISTEGDWTPGFYEVVTYHDAGSVALDRDPAVLPGDSIDGGSGKLGGAQSDFDKVLPEVIAGPVYANTIYIKQGTYKRGINWTGAFSPVNDGSYQHPITVRGYKTTRDDASEPCVVLDGDNSSVYDVIYTTKKFWNWDYLDINGYVGGAASYSKRGIDVADSAAYGNHFWRCRVHNVGHQAVRLVGIGSTIEGSEISGWGKVTAVCGCSVGGNGTAAIACNAHDGNGSGYGLWTGYAGLDFCIAHHCDSHGAEIGGNVGSEHHRVYLRHFISYANDGDGVCIYGSAAGQSVLIENGLIVNNGGYGIGTYGSLDARTILRGVGFGGNTSGEIDEGSVTVNERVARISGIGDPFIDGANGDFRLKPEATAILGKGWPAQFLHNGELTSWAGYPDLGAVQFHGVGAVGVR